ncbi:hypothetical protein ACLB2K_038686 [Fragaria x ananassa]
MGMKSNPTRSRKRVEATAEGPSLVRGKDGSAFARCEGCKKDVPVATISFHSCSLDAKIRNNLETQVVEKPTQVTKKPPTARNKKSTTSEPNAKRVKKSKDPNAPKRPLTAFFLFIADFRKSYKEANPDSKDVKKVAKEGGEKWKLLTDDLMRLEKKPYIDKADELKAEFKKTLETEADDAEDVDGEAEDASEKEVPEKEVEEVSDGE